MKSRLSFPGRWTLVTAPVEEPVSLAEMKLHLRVEFADDDALISTLIQAARERFEGEIDVAFVTQTWDYTVETFPQYAYEDDSAIWKRVANVLELPKGPLASVTSLTYVAADATTKTLVQGADFLARVGSPGAVYPYAITAPWPYTRQQLDAVTIRAVYGYGAASAVPAAAKAAIKLMVGHLYANREATADPGVMEIPLGVKYLLGNLSWGSRP